MAEGVGDAEDYNIPEAITEEVDKKTVEVYIDIDDLEVKWKVPGIGSSELKKHCSVQHSFNKESFEVRATVEKDGDVKKYKYCIQKLPGEITPEDCKIKYKDGQITLILRKKESTSWATAMQKGLEQAK